MRSFHDPTASFTSALAITSFFSASANVGRIAMSIRNLPCRVARVAGIQAKMLLAAARGARPAHGNTLRSMERRADTPVNLNAEVEKALLAAERIAALAQESNGDFSRARTLFEMLNVRAFLQFQPVQEGKRTLNRLSGGVVTWGDAPLPIEPYCGPTNRKLVKTSKKNNSAIVNAEPKNLPKSSIVSNEEEHSLGNPSRGDTI